MSILTLSNAGTIYPGKAIHSIQLGSEIACISGGKKWKDSLNKDDQGLASFVCIEE